MEIKGRKEGFEGEDLRLLMALMLMPEMGPVACKRLIDAFGDLDRIFGATDAELRAECPALRPETSRAILRGPDWEAVEKQEEACQINGVQPVSFYSEEFPEPLLGLPAAPPILFMKGRWIWRDKMSVSVVGTRHPTSYGEKVGKELCLGLAEAGWTVVSGLARGIDTFAHESALRAGSRTLAVLGSGLDCMYPPENAGLARRIVENGCLISEFPMGTLPRANNFPRRNRLISALSLGTLVVEAGAESGALITAEYALDQGKEIFSVPGSVHSPASRGTHQLIQEGAHLVTSHFDILRLLEGVSQAVPSRRVSFDAGRSVSTVKRKSAPVSSNVPATGSSNAPVAKRPQRDGGDEKQQTLLGLLDSAALSLDSIAEKAGRHPLFKGYSPHEFLPDLLELEMQGRLRRLPGSLFRLA